MLRSFLPIGQGGFAVEQFDDARYNVVFDCGTSTANGKSSARQAIEDQIRQTFGPKTKIQKVFISHLHADHINGLPFLLRYPLLERNGGIIRGQGKPGFPGGTPIGPLKGYTTRNGTTVPFSSDFNSIGGH